MWTHCIVIPGRILKRRKLRWIVKEGRKETKRASHFALPLQIPLHVVCVVFIFVECWQNNSKRLSHFFNWICIYILKIFYRSTFQIQWFIYLYCTGLHLKRITFIYLLDLFIFSSYINISLALKKVNNKKITIIYHDNLWVNI